MIKERRGDAESSYKLSCFSCFFGRQNTRCKSTSTSSEFGFGTRSDKLVYLITF